MTQITPVSRHIGYARVSTEGQDLAYQLERLQAAGCIAFFHEKRSGKNTHDRPQLRKMLKGLKPGDLVLATLSDRIARDPVDMLHILETIKEAGAGLRLLDELFSDTTSEMADLFLFILGWIARWHRRRILKNTADGRAMAKARGVKFGRKPKLTPWQRAQVIERKARGEPYALIARSYGVSERTILRTSS